MSAYTERRFGKFVLSHELIEDSYDLVREFMGQMVILDVERRFDINGIKYTAVSDLFKVLEEGFEIPEYILKYEVNDSEAGRKLSAILVAEK